MSGLTVTLLMTIAEFVPARSAVIQGKALVTNLARFCCLEPANGKTRAALGGNVSGALTWLARQGGKKALDEIALAVKTRIVGSQ